MAINKLPRSGIADSAVTSAKVGDGLINASTEFPDCNIASTRLADCAVTNAKLSNSAITIRGSSTALGASLTVNPDVNWQSVVVSDGSTVTTMVAFRGYFVNNASAAGIVKLPSSASIGDTIKIKDYAANFGTNNLTIQRNSHKIQGTTVDAIIDTNRASLTAVYIDATQGWVFTDESNVGDLRTPLFTEATGGTVATAGDFKIHTFTGDGNFVVSQAGNAPVPGAGPGNVDYLVVAGGASGGHNRGSGGGGAGGHRTTFPSPGCNAGAFPISAQTYPITVGGGGATQSSSQAQGNAGSNSVFSTITSTGGGGGGGSDNAGGNGGSGGGGSATVNNTFAVGSGNTPPVSPSQGNNGGTASGGPGGNQAGGGGGGIGAVGANAPGNNNAGNGGAGTANSITNSSVTRAGGGGGGATGYESTGNEGSGGSGGGGRGSGGSAGAGNQPGEASVAGTANTGGGGGGGGQNNPGQESGAAGGSGVVIIRYKYQ